MLVEQDPVAVFVVAESVTSHPRTVAHVFPVDVVVMVTWLETEVPWVIVVAQSDADSVSHWS